MTEIQFSGDDRFLFSLGLDATIRQWTVADGANVATIDLSNESTITKFDLIDGTDNLICGHEDGSLTIKNIALDQTIRRSQPFYNSVNGLAVPANCGVAFVTSTNSTAITCVDVNNLETIGELQLGANKILGLSMDLDNQQLQILTANGNVTVLNIRVNN